MVFLAVIIITMNILLAFVLLFYDASVKDISKR